MNVSVDPIIAVPFSKVTGFDIGVVGQKGANLGALLSLKVPVPNGFIVTTNAFDLHFTQFHLTEFIRKELAFVDAADTVKIENSSMRIRRGIIKYKLDEEISAQIIKAYSGVSGFSDAYVAVRSSSPIEELKLDAFTGQHSTFLNVRGKEELLEKLISCWASLFSPKNIFYALNRGFDISSMKMAVVVQKMVQAEASGILYTVNPIDNNPSKMSIDAVLGLGEVLSSGQINPDTYIVDKEQEEIAEKHIVPQEWMLVRKGRSKKGEDPNVKVQVGEVWKARQKVSTPHIVHLIKIGKKIETHFKVPQEVEWTYEGGKIWVVQSRPMSKVIIEDPDLWKKAPTVEALRAKVQQAEVPQLNTVSPLQPLPPKPKTGLEAYNKDNVVLLSGRGVSGGVVSAPLKKIVLANDIKSNDAGVIIVTSALPQGIESYLKNIVGILIDGEVVDHEMFELLKEFGGSCIVNTEVAFQILKDGEVITINGTTGEVLSGATAEGLLNTEKFKAKKDVDVQVSNKGSRLKEPKVSASKVTNPVRRVLPTATKIFVNIDDPDSAQSVAAQQVSGALVLDSERMVTRLGVHPQQILREKARKEQYVNALSIQLYRFGRLFEPSPVIYSLSDPTSSEYRNLEGGIEIEPVEANPLIGFRGLNRIITHNEEPMLELEALRVVRNKESIRNISLALPFARTYTELLEAKHLVAKAGFRRSASFRIFAQIEVPAAVIRIERMLALGIDGVIVDTNSLSQTLLAYDRENPRLQTDYYVSHPALLWALERIIRACNSNKVQTVITGDLLQDSKAISKLVAWGVSALSTSANDIDRLRQDVVSAERRLITKRK